MTDSLEESPHEIPEWLIVVYDQDFCHGC